MKILVFSDSHGNTSRMITALYDHGNSVGMIIHLGDGVRDIEYVSSRFPEIPLVSIKGNGETVFRDTRTVNTNGITITCMHGHSFGVKRDMMRAVLFAEETEADILLYGHTHVAEDRCEILNGDRRLKVFNPGSIGRGYPPSYGIIDIPRDSSFMTSHAYL